MKFGTKNWRIGLVMVVVALALLGSTMAFARNANPGVLPPNSHAFGKTYGEWSAKWWQWAVNIPASNSPIVDTTGADCAVNQSGKVWFLAGTATSTAGGPAVTRTCTVPSGKAILFPIINAECSTIEGNGTTQAQLSACAKGIIDPVATVTATVDGVNLQDLTPPNSPYRVQSPLFTFKSVQDNPFSIPAGQSPSVADGYWILLAPLSTGQHTIHFLGAIPNIFTTEVIYNLTVG
jgi:hypothetical protein